jgi:DNA-binding XRE family transcriptional regulator
MSDCMLDPLDPTTLKDARVSAKLTRSQLSSVSGVHETTIMRIEKGEVDPRLDGTWAPLARAVMAAEAGKPARRKAAA